MRRVAYWVVALAVTAFLLVEMRRYLAVPGAGAWDRVATVIKGGWQDGDQMLFTPPWLAGYAMDRKRYLGLTLPHQAVKDAGDLAPGSRLWLVSLGRARLEGDFAALSTSRVGPVEIWLLQRR